MNEFTMTEKLMLREVVKYYRNAKSAFLHPKDLLLLDTMLKKLELDERTTKVIVEIKRC